MSLSIRRTELGRGLFATRNFKPGEFIIEYFGIKISASEAAKSRSRYIFSLNKKTAIDGANRANIARYINHSCKPNVLAVGSKRLWIEAVRRIKEGEELTLDYGREYLDRFIPVCKCPVHSKS